MARREDEYWAEKERQNRRRNKSGWAIAASLFILLADGLYMWFWEPVSEAFHALLTTPSAAAVYTHLGLYLGFVLSLWAIRWLKPIAGRAKGRDSMAKFLYVFPGTGFALLMVMAAVIVSGMGEPESDVVEGVQQLAVFGATFLLFVQLPLMFVKDKPRYRPDQPQYFAILIPTVFMNSIMLAYSSALWLHYFGDEAGTTIEDPSFGWSFAFALPIYVFLFAAPRWTFMSKYSSTAAVLSGLVLVLYTVGRLVTVFPLI